MKCRLDIFLELARCKILDGWVWWVMVESKVGEIIVSVVQNMSSMMKT